MPGHPVLASAIEYSSSSQTDDEAAGDISPDAPVPFNNGHLIPYPTSFKTYPRPAWKHHPNIFDPETLSTQPEVRWVRCFLRSSFGL